MALGGLVFSVGSLVSALSPNLACLFVGRSVAGIGEGLFLSVGTLPAAWRGSQTENVLHRSSQSTGAVGQTHCENLADAA